MWTQYIATTSRNMRYGDDVTTSTVTFWLNEHGEVDRDNLSNRELNNFLSSLSKGHEVECDSTGVTVEEEE